MAGLGRQPTGGTFRQRSAGFFRQDDAVEELKSRVEEMSEDERKASDEAAKEARAIIQNTFRHLGAKTTTGVKEAIN